MREWAFRVEGVTAPGEVMCVVGSCTELGEWSPERIVPMKIVTSLDTMQNTAPSAVSENSNPHIFLPCHHEGHDGFSVTSETNRNSS